MKLVSIVIGVYNSEKTITSVVNEIEDVFRNSKYDYEIILVNDCSPDGVYEIIKDLASKNKRIKALKLAKNSGQTNAVVEGYKYAKGDYVVEMDDDYQMPATQIIPMVELLEQGDYDVVFAKYKQKQESPFRLFGSKINAKMTEILLGRPKNIEINSFFVMRKFVADTIAKYASNYPYLYGIIFSVTKNVANLEMEHRPRTNGKSNYTFSKLLGLWMNGFLNYSVAPLRISTYMGFLITLVSFIFAIILVIQRLLYPTKSMGWTSIMVMMILFSGIILMSIGILGEYLGRLFISSSGLPRTTVKETINIDKEEKENE